MILDKQTNFVYFSDQLLSKGFTIEYNKITSILNKHGIEHGLLTNTKDIWCRDYMPIQISKSNFLQFQYNPWYLNDTAENRKLKSDPKKVNPLNNISARYSDIIMDGGNVIKGKNFVIMTDRIFDENGGDWDDNLINQLETDFNSTVKIIAQLDDELTGHADGIVRSYKENIVLINELKYFEKGWAFDFIDILEEEELKYIEIPMFIDNKSKYSGYTDSAIGLYINFLEFDNLIIIPKFEIPGNKDKIAFEKFIELYPAKVIEQVEINEIAKLGGLLNCISWNIYK